MMGTSNVGRVGVGQRRGVRVRQRRESSIGPSRNDARRCVVASSSGRRSVARERTERMRGRRRGGGRSRGTRPRGRESRTWSWRRTSRRVRSHARGGCAPRKRQSAIFTVEDLPGAPKRRFLIGGRDRQNRPGSGFAPSVESIEGLRGLIAEVPEESINLTHVGSISEPGFRTRGARREFGSSPRLETAVFIIASGARDGEQSATMPAPSGHGQRNKKHNTGRHASKSTRGKHKVAGEDGPAHRRTIKVRAHARRRRRSPRALPDSPSRPPPPRTLSVLTTKRLTPPAPTLSADRRRRRQQG